VSIITNREECGNLDKSFDARRCAEMLRRSARLWKRSSILQDRGEARGVGADQSLERSNELAKKSMRLDARVGARLQATFGLKSWDHAESHETAAAVILTDDGAMVVQIANRDHMGPSADYRAAVVLDARSNPEPAEDPEPPAEVDQAEVLELIRQAHENMARHTELEKTIWELEDRKRALEAEFRDLVDRLGPMVERLTDNRDFEDHQSGALLLDFDGQPHLVEVSKSVQREGWWYTERPLLVPGGPSGGSAV
jgi:hypothetical protein